MHNNEDTFGDLTKPLWFQHFEFHIRFEIFHIFWDPARSILINYERFLLWFKCTLLNALLCGSNKPIFLPPKWPSLCEHAVFPQNSPQFSIYAASPLTSQAPWPLKSQILHLERIWKQLSLSKHTLLLPCSPQVFELCPGLVWQTYSCFEALYTGLVWRREGAT